MRFPATVGPAGNATGIEVRAGIVTALGAGERPEVAKTINGHTWRSRVASRGGRFIVGISAANRAACGIAEGDRVEAELQPGTEPGSWPDHPTWPGTRRRPASARRLRPPGIRPQAQTRTGHPGR